MFLEAPWGMLLVVRLCDCDFHPPRAINAGNTAAAQCRNLERRNRLEPGAHVRIVCPERRTQRGP
jgi:hypothetical protein